MVFDTSYIIELETAILHPSTKGSYNIKDVKNRHLGSIKIREASLEFEGENGTPLGEMRPTDNGIEVSDAQNQLRGSIKQKRYLSGDEERFKISRIIRFPPILVGILLFVAFGLMIMLNNLASLPIFSDSFFFICFIGGFVLTFIGIIFLEIKTAIEVSQIKCMIENSEGQQMAEARQASRFKETYQIINHDGELIARINKKRGLQAAFRNAYSIDVLYPSFDPFLILSYAVKIAQRYRAEMATVLTSE